MLVLIQGAACFLEDESMFAGFAEAGVAVESPKSLKDLPDLSN
jgi:hypothetical protein